MDLSDTILRAEQEHVMHTYKRLPGLFIRGEGCYLWDSEENQYLDFLAGIAVCQLGHCHPALVEAITHQAKQLIHTSNHLVTAPQALLAQRLCELTEMDSVFFINDGTSAAETALKLMKKHGLAKRPDGDYEIITLTRSFHGRTLGALTATAQGKYQDSFRPLLPGFVHIAANDTAALSSAFSERTAGVLFEPIQGEGGVTPITQEFAQCARELCDTHDAFLGLDEVQTGVGRTGRWFNHERFGFSPDILCVAKGLGSGIPIAACLARGKAAGVFDYGDHGSTFGGNPLCCASALAVLETIEKDGLLANAAERGAQLRTAFESIGSPVKEVRGEGLMLGVLLDRPIAREVVARCLQMRLITNATDEYTLRIVPPIIVTASQVDEAMEIYSEALLERAAVPQI